jgi:hypothetical protein
MTIGTGHVLLGLIDIDESNVVAALAGAEVARRICATVVELLPGNEAASIG